MSVGVEALDLDHQRLLDITVQLEDAVIGGAENDEIAGLLDLLIDYAHSHLKREEFIMDGLGFEDTSPHKATHEVFRRWSKDFKDRYDEEADPGISETVLEYLNSWWINHILKSDMEYKNVFCARKAEVDALIKEFNANHPEDNKATS